MGADLCRGWTESKIVEAVTSATDLQRKILRSMAENYGTTVREIADDVGAKTHRAVAGALSGWYQDTTRPSASKIPPNGRDSWPFRWEYVVQDGRRVARYLMPLAVARVVIANT